MSTKDKKLKEEKEQQDLYRAKLDNMIKKTGEYQKEIDDVSRKWRNKVRFANSLIQNKTYNIIHKLDVIENLLPGGVYIKNITLKIEANSGIVLTVISDSYPNLFEVYKNLSKYEPTIVKESEADGIFTSSINLNLTEKNEKK